MKFTFRMAALAVLLIPIAGLWAAKPAAKPAPHVVGGDQPPDRLSDLYKVFNGALHEGLGADVQAWPIRIVGRTFELMRDGHFPEVELTLKPFQAQGLSFEKAEILFKKMSVDREALEHWKLKLQEVREVESRLIFTMRSLAQKLSKAAGQELSLKADAEAQTVLLIQRGRFLFIPCTVEATCELQWDDSAKQLRLKTKEARYGGHSIWRWFWWLGSQPAPKEPILDLGFSWIPFNIQEVHVSWDRVNLTTNW
jgi:hypothetical protein